MLTITRPKVKHTHGPHCTCRPCRIEWAEYWAEQRETHERVMREHLARCGYYEPCDDVEETWVAVMS